MGAPREAKSHTPTGDPHIKTQYHTSAAEKELEDTRRYILDNPEKWATDEYNKKIGITTLVKKRASRSEG